VCWIATGALVLALLIKPRPALLAIGIATALVAAWFAWAMWIVTTPPFARLPFQFVGTDVIGPGWYATSVGLLVGAVAVVRAVNENHERAGVELWVLSTLPGYGLMRLGRWDLGLIFTALVAGTIYLGSIDSPDSNLFVEFGRSNNVPPAIPRGPEWVLLSLAAVFWLMSIAATVLERRRQSQPSKNGHR
jgi:hypothetical protein